MEDLTQEIAIRQALATIQQYLSDSIAPLLAAESVSMLLDHPAGLVATEIAHWASGQYQQKNTNAAYSDYLFHAMKKLFEMGGLKLVPEERLAEYLQELKPHILELCPAEDRNTLAAEMDHLGQSEPTLMQTLAYVHRMRDQSGGPRSSRGRESGLSELARMRRRLSILWKRLGKETVVPEEATPATAANREGLLSHVVATAANAATTDREFRQLQERLKSLGIDSGTDQIFRVLSRNLPGWSIPVMPSGEPGKPSVRQNPAVEAMRQIMMLSEDGSEGCKRLQDLVQAAIEQFNGGSLARAATMFDLATNLAGEAKLDFAALATVRGTAHESLDSERLRACAKQIEKHQLLRKVLNFFDAFKVENLLVRLQKETKRDQRRLILSLLEVQGGKARETAFHQLRRMLTVTDFTQDWYYPRNLVCLLNRIPMPEDAVPEAEIEVMSVLLNPSLPVPLVREVIANLGQMKHPNAEKLLIETAKDLERILLDPHIPKKNPAQQVALLDRTIFALAHYSTAAAYSAVVDHGLRRNELLGDTMARLAYLNGQDLSSDAESVARLVKTLKSRTPLKLFGVVIQKNDQIPLHLVRALASTPAPIVQALFENISERFSDKEFGRAASNALEGFAAAGKRSELTTERLMGDLELFSLPDLLQQLALLQLTGTLTIKDAGGTSVGAMSLIGGRMKGCSVGRLQGEFAAYQILERPIVGSFLFQGRRERAPADQAGAGTLIDLRTILFEGMRRYDELERACAIVPDAALLKPTGVEPRLRPGEDDPEFFNQLWLSIGPGATPEKCEAECCTDSYGVRSLLARWVEEDILNVN